MQNTDDAGVETKIPDERVEMIEAAAELLYGLIHARYIVSARGLAAMLEKYNNAEFGRCPRVYCQAQSCLPIGQSDLPRLSTVKLYCPRCQDIYFPPLSKHSSIDGSYFGTTFPHLLLQTYPEIVPAPATLTYTPRIFGFKLHQAEYKRMAVNSKAADI